MSQGHTAPPKVSVPLQKGFFFFGMDVIGSAGDIMIAGQELKVDEAELDGKGLIISHTVLFRSCMVLRTHRGG